MKIRITRGIYGFRENGNVVEKTSSSAPFEVDEDEGNRLISLQVAEKVNCQAAIDDMLQNQEAGPEKDDVLAQIGNISKEKLEEMSKKDLCIFAEALGIDKAGNKSELVERLQQCRVWAEDAEELDGEEMPELTPEEPE